MTVLKKGDIYRWTWRGPKGRECGRYDNYHCKSQIAKFDGKNLVDTFWACSPTDNSYLDPDDVDLVLLGNTSEMTVLADQSEYYRPEDLVDMRHRNHSTAPIYLKKGATRDKETMLELVRRKQRDAKHKIESAQFALSTLSENEEKIANDDLENVFI